MKKRGVFFVFLLVLILSSFFVSAANDTSAKAYSCLEDKVAGKCSSLTAEEKVFSLLAIDRCKSELLSDSMAGNCWPNVGCKIKTTAQAILALNRVNADTLNAENWLRSQTAISADLDWFLQVDSDAETTCDVSYSGNKHSLTIDDDKTISGNMGNCLSIYNKYWLKISPNCYDSEFQISCRDSFRTSLLYKKKTSSTIYVSQKTNSASGEGTTTEKVSSSCFKEGSSCSYEGTLWAALVLDYRKYPDVSKYIPYLVAMADEPSNVKYLPEAFLYYLTDDFRTELLAKQSENQWWAPSGDKFYDTAVALLPFQNEQLSEKTNAIDWLSEVQGTDGCWQGNIRNTAFLLYSIWPRKVANVSTAKDCEDSGYYCISSAACTDASGTLMTDYTGCFTDVCCSSARHEETCSEQNGELCDEDEECLGGSTVSASDASSGESCCIDGECGTQEETASECEINEGYCKSVCSSTEEFSELYCSSGNCCMPKPAPSNILLIVILSVLIFLVLLGIIFRKKLRGFFSKIKMRKGRPRGPPGRPVFFPPPSRRVFPGAVQRRILTQPRQPIRQPASVARPAAKPLTKGSKKSEVDEVLKKLKEIGK